ncbi:hypothetical protein Q7P37_006090 [Cladosporium fusiforme]
MCGVSAVFNLRKKQPTTNRNADCIRNDRAKLADKLDRSVESQRHRGPDAKGVWTSADASVGLAHVRLSTRDLSCAGHQPLHSSDEADDIHTVVNGELYYDPELRTSLEQTYKFSSTSDSEMVIALFKTYGTDFLEKLRGEFSLIVYDGKSQTLLVARDRFGVKPLHYGVIDGKLLIATQCKGISELLDDGKELRWDVKGLAEGGGYYTSRTLFENVSKFPPGHSLVVRPGDDTNLDFKPYWQTEYPPNSGHSDERPTTHLVEELREKLMQSVRLRLASSDVPIGILLSGGVDSSAVAGMATDLTKRGLGQTSGGAAPLPTCFTIGFPDDGTYDESAVATRTAEHLGLPIEKVVVTEQILADEFDSSCWLGETLMFDLQHIAKKAMSKHIASKKLKVVLNGDGSDELFGGYSFFVSDRLEADDERRAPELQSTVPGQRELVHSRYTNDVKWFGAEQAQDGEENEYARALGLPPAFCKLAVSTYHDWLPRDLSDSGDPFKAIFEQFRPDEREKMIKSHPMHRAMWAWQKTMLPNLVIAAISDGAEMAHSVESRPPFLDHVVAEFAQTLPVDMLVHLDGEQVPTEKNIFREAVRPYVTDEIYRRRKQAFAAPFRWKKGGPLYDRLSSLITRENVQQLGFADWEQCRSMVDRCFDEENEDLFRKSIWLAQIISIGLQFKMPTWIEGQSELPNGKINGHANGH